MSFINVLLYRVLVIESESIYRDDNAEFLSTRWKHGNHSEHNKNRFNSNSVCSETNALFVEPSKDSQSNEIFGLPFLQYRPCRGQVCRICVSVVCRLMNIQLQQSLWLQDGYFDLYVDLSRSNISYLNWVKCWFF